MALTKARQPLISSSLCAKLDPHGWITRRARIGFLIPLACSLFVAAYGAR
jgi:hypothetical protein